jgi:hypothetical protein
MPDEASASAIAPEQAATVHEDGRLTWTVTEAAVLLGISRASAPMRRPTAASCRSG